MVKKFKRTLAIFSVLFVLSIASMVTVSTALQLNDTKTNGPCKGDLQVEVGNEQGGRSRIRGTTSLINESSNSQTRQTLEMWLYYDTILSGEQGTWSNVYSEFGQQSISETLTAGTKWGRRGNAKHSTTHNYNYGYVETNVTM